MISKPGHTISQACSQIMAATMTCDTPSDELSVESSMSEESYKRSSTPSCHKFTTKSSKMSSEQKLRRLLVEKDQEISALKNKL